MTTLQDLPEGLDAMVAWNERHGVSIDTRILKITEENGEVADAWVGYTGANPRKGVTNGIDKVWEELSDVALSALIVIESTGGDAVDELLKRMQFVVKRAQEEAP